MRIVLRIGGSVIASPMNSNLISEYANLLRAIKKQGHELAVVVGGGALARDFIAVAKDLKLGERAQDEIAISVSRIFAQLFLKKLGETSCKTVPLKIGDAAKSYVQGKIVVMGGLKPGMTTDTVAALIAQRVKADLLIKASNQEGVYDKDPQKYRNAVRLTHLRFDDLSRVCAEDKHRPGIHQVIDPEAIRILMRRSVKVIVLNGFEPKNIMRAIKGKRVGTLVD